MEYTRFPENIVSSFFFYMWNSWCEEEAKIVFPEDHLHLWQKWCSIHKKFNHISSERFYAELDDVNCKLICNRACEIYNGKKRIK